MPGWQERLALVAQRNRQEIVNAKLSRREMIRLGLLTSAGTLVLKSGLSSRAAYAADPPPSPRHTAWALPMPILPVLDPISAQDHHNMIGGDCTGFTAIDGGKSQITHQVCGGYPNGKWQYPAYEPKKYYEMVMNEGEQVLAKDWRPTKVWGFGGWNTSRYPNRYPGVRINAYYGEPVMVRYHNQLPWSANPNHPDPAKRHRSFGIPEIATHLHNAHTPSESDGNPADYIPSALDVDESYKCYGGVAQDPRFPADPTKKIKLSFKDQYYPNLYAGFTGPIGPRNPEGKGDPREALSSLWFHDHHHDFTAQNVVKGMVGCYTLFDNLDTGDEGTGLRLPSGEFDVPVFLGDFVIGQDFQVQFDLFNADGIIGDKQTCNGVIQPYMEVTRRPYRFRFYNNGPARFYHLALYDGSNYLDMWQLSADGNLLPKPLKTKGIRLFVAERADVVIDFGKLDPAKKYHIVNRMEQKDGRGPEDDLIRPGTALLQFRLGGNVLTHGCADLATVAKLRDLPDDFAALMAKLNDPGVKKRTFRFDRTNGSWTVNGKLFDEHEIMADPALGAEEIWTLSNSSGGWQHPVHMHFEEHRMLTRNGVAIAAASQDYGRKDVAAVGENEEVKVFMRFRDVPGRYVMHCHNVMHEDSGMMMRFDIGGGLPKA